MLVQLLMGCGSETGVYPRLDAPLSGDPGCESYPDGLGLPPGGWPGPWAFELSPDHALLPSDTNLVGPILLIPHDWMDPGAAPAPTIVAAAFDGGSIVPTATYACPLPCVEWSVVGLTGLLAFAVATPAAAVVSDNTIATTAFLRDGEPFGPFQCSSVNLEAAPVVPAVGPHDELVLLNADPSCGVTMPSSETVAPAVRGWGQVVPIADDVVYLTGVRRFDVLTGESEGTVGGVPPEDQVGHPSFTIVIGNPPVIVEATGSSIRGRSIEDGQDRFHLDVLPMLADGEPCAGDLDGDGVFEFVVPLRNQLWTAEFRAYDLHGSLLWSDLSENSTRGATCSVADLDGDGANEVLITDEQSFRILDGRRGTRLFLDDTLASVTANDYPIVADLDGDGSSEILVGAAVFGTSGDVIRGERAGLFVYTHPLGTLNGHPPFWPGSYMHHTNVDADGRLLPDFAPWWEDPRTDGHHRMITDTPSCPDLAPTVSEICTFDGDDVTVDVLIENIGTLPVDGAVTVELRTADETLVSEARVDPPDPGEPPARVRLGALERHLSEGPHIGIRFDGDGPHAGCENPALQARW